MTQHQYNKKKYPIEHQKTKEACNDSLICAMNVVRLFSRSYSTFNLLLINQGEQKHLLIVFFHSVSVMRQDYRHLCVSDEGENRFKFTQVNLHFRL